jgi:hypothetical protein
VSFTSPGVCDPAVCHPSSAVPAYRFSLSNPFQFSAGLYHLIPNVKSDPETRSAVEKVRLKIAERGGLNGIRTLAAIMRTMDNSGTCSMFSPCFVRVCGSRALTSSLVRCRRSSSAVVCPPCSSTTSCLLPLLLPTFLPPGDRKLDREELKYGLRDYGVALSERELDTVLGAFDKNKDGRIDFDEFLRGVRVRACLPACLNPHAPFSFKQMYGSLPC